MVDLWWLVDGWQAGVLLVLGIVVGRAWQALLWRDPPKPNPWLARSCRDWDPERWTRGVWS